MKDERNKRSNPGGSALHQRAVCQRRSTAPDAGHASRPHHRNLLRLTLMALFAILGMQGAWAEKITNPSYHTPATNGEIVWMTKANCDTYYSQGWVGNNNSSNGFANCGNISVEYPSSQSGQYVYTKHGADYKNIHMYVTGVTSVIAYAKNINQTNVAKLQVIATPVGESATSGYEVTIAANEEGRANITGLDKSKQYQLYFKNDPPQNNDLPLVAVQLFTNDYPPEMYLVYTGGNWNATAANKASSGSGDQDGIYTWKNVEIAEASWMGFAFSAVTGPDGSIGDYRYGPSSTTTISLTDGVGTTTNLQSAAGNAAYGLGNSGKYDITLNLRTNTVTVVESPNLVDDLTNLTKLNNSGTANFYIETQWPNNGGKINTNTYSNSGRMAIIADSRHYITLSSGNRFTFTDPQDNKCAFMVLEPTSPGWLYVELEGTNTKHTGAPLRNNVSINNTAAWNSNALSSSQYGMQEATEAENWIVKKAFASTPGRIYISAYDGLTVKRVLWVAYSGAPTIKAPSINDKTSEAAGKYEIAVNKFTDIAEGGLDRDYYKSSYIKYWVDNGSEQTYTSGNKTDVTGVTSSLKAKHVLKYADPSGAEHEVESAETQISVGEPTINSYSIDGENLKVTVSNATRVLYTIEGQRETGVWAGNNGGTASIPLTTLGTNKFKLRTVNGNTSEMSAYTPNLVIVNNQAVLVNPDFEADGGAGWTGTGSVSSMKGGDTNGNNCAEAFQKTSFDINQELTGLSNGVYEVTVQAFNRGQEVDKAYAAYKSGDKDITTYLYANGYEVPVKSLYDEVVDNLQGTVSTKGGNKYPNMPNSSADAFSKGNYQVKLLAWVTDGKLKIGIKGGSDKTASWSSWDNFSVRYLGADLVLTQSEAEQYLQPLTGDKTWEGNYFNFSLNRTNDAYYNNNGADDGKHKGVLNQDNNLLLCVRGKANHTYAYEDKLYFHGGNEGTGVKFIVPTAGTIKFTLNDNNYARIKIGNNAAVSLAQPAAVDGKYEYSYPYDGTEPATVQIFCSLNGYEIYKIEYLQKQELMPLTGSYIWSPALDNFGPYQTYTVNTANPLADSNKIQYAPSDAATKNRNVIVTNEGVTLQNPAGNGVKFLIPGPGIIKATIKNTNGRAGDMALSLGGTEVATYAASDFRTIEYNILKDTKHTFTYPLEVFIKAKAGGSGNTAYIKEIQYISIKDYDAENPPVTHTWTGTENADWAGYSSGQTITTMVTNHNNDNGAAAPATRDLCIIANADHPITWTSNGYTFGAQSDGSTFGYLTFSAASSGIVKVWATPKPGSEADSRLSVSGGTAPKDRWTEIATDGDEPTYQLAFFDLDNTRSVYIGGTEGVTITRIEWMPKNPTDADHKFLTPVSTTHNTTWSKANNYGGFGIKADGENPTYVEIDILNPGSRPTGNVTTETEENTLMIYGANSADKLNTQTEFSKNGIFTTKRSPAAEDHGEEASQRYTGDHFMEFRVTTPGVVKVSGAGNGASGRTIKVGTSLDSNIMEETHDDQPADKNDSEEHIGQIDRHQHDSDHTFYCYFDGKGASAEHPVSIYVYGRGGVNITELTWMPNVHISDVVQNDLVPANALRITDQAGNVFDQDGNKKVPQNILLNSWDYTANNYEGARKPNIDDYSYKLYARVDIPTDMTVNTNNLAPVWTTSGRGRSGYMDSSVLQNCTQEVRMGGSDMTSITGSVNPATDGNTSYVSTVYNVVPAERYIAASTDGSNIAAYTHPGFGVNYVVAGTTEGNRTDIRRIEIAGPASGLDVLYHKPKTYEKGEENAGKTVYPVKVVKGKSVSLTVNPYLMYHDVDGDIEHYVYGTDVRIKVDNPTVTWYESDIDGNPLASGSGSYTSSYLETPLRNDTNQDGFTPGDTDYQKDLSKLLVGIKSNAAAGTTYITARIDGVEVNGNGYRAKRHIAVFEIKIEENGIFLARILPDGPETDQKPKYDANGAPVYEKDDVGNNLRQYETVSEKRVWDVSVTDPIVYKVTGNLTVTEDGTDSNGNPQYAVMVDNQYNVSTNGMLLPLYVKDEKNYGTLEVPAKVVVKKVNAAEGESSGSYYDVYFVYDVVDALQNGRIAGTDIGNLGEHMNFDTDNSGEFRANQTYGSPDNDDKDNRCALYNYLGGSSGDHNQYNFKFHTIPDRIGEELETFVYNVAQRTDGALEKDFSQTGKTESRLLSEHLITNEWTTTYKTDGSIDEEKTTFSWYGNKRSYIKTPTRGGFKYSNPMDGRIRTLETVVDNDNGTKSKIEITPYNGSLTGKRGVIKCIEVNFDDDYSNENTVGSVKLAINRDGNSAWQYDELGAAKEIKSSTNFTAIWDNLDTRKADLRNASLEFQNTGMKISQIKITYYSAVREERTLQKCFESYSADNWERRMKSGIELEGKHYLEKYGYTGDNVRESNIKLYFVDDNARHFAIREDWERYAADETGNDGITHWRGEKKTRNTVSEAVDNPEPYTTLVMRDDKTAPCRMYVYTKNNVAEISSVEFICEDDNANGLSSRNLYCTNDPRYFLDPTGNNLDESTYTYVGCPFEQVANVSLATGEPVGSSTGFHKLVYRPESPTNFVFITGDPQQEGYFFVRKVIVRYDNTARVAEYVLNSSDNKNELKSLSIAKVDLNTKGIKLQIPAENDIEAYTIKRTSSRNNLSKEVVLDEDNSTIGNLADINGKHYPVLRDREADFTNFRHRKFYTVRVLDHNRLVTRQLSFRTKDNEKPIIKLNGTDNEELRSEQSPITALASNDITINPVADNTNHPAGQLIIWTDDASAPSVTFGRDGYTVTDINGNIAAGSSPVTLSSSSYFGGADCKKSIAIKAISLPLSATVSTAYDKAGWIANIGNKTFGETTDITRANYVYANPNTTHFTSAYRGTDNELMIDWAKAHMTGNLTTDNGTHSLRSLYDITEYNDRMHAGFPTEVKQNSVSSVKMYYGGYELYATKDENGNDNFSSTYEGETYKADRFRRDIVKNDYWKIAANDLTPYRGLPGIIGGDAYMISNVEPLNEGALYKSSSYSVEDERNTIAHQDSYAFGGNGMRVFNGEFDYPAMLNMRTVAGTESSYDRTWSLPCYGNYFQYEPQKNGKLTVYVKQQGVLDQKVNGTLDDMLLRYRPVFVLDEAGQTPDNLTASTTSKVSGDWMATTHTGLKASKYLAGDAAVSGFTPEWGGSTISFVNGAADNNASANLYNMCQAWIRDNTYKLNAGGTGAELDNGHKQYEYGDRAYQSQGVMNMYGTQGAGDYTAAENYRNKLLGVNARGNGKPNGFLIISEGYVKYEFDVKAGKTYFVFAQNGNLGMCAYEFEEDASAQYEASGSLISETDCNNLASAVGKTYKVFNTGRSFTKDKWFALVLPFSVSKSQLREVFGDGVHLSHFQYVTNKHLQLGKHVHQMVVAGVPVFIKPSENGVANFHDVTVEVSEPSEVYTNCYGLENGQIGAGKIAYVCKGTFRPDKYIVNKDIYISGGQFAERASGSLRIGTTRSWIEPVNYSVTAMKLMSVGYGWMIGDEEDDDATTVESVLIEEGGNSDAVNAVYNIKGQLVRKNTTSLEGLPAGVYIVNGVKQVVR